ncbi:MAG TPA: HNH endonuclease, partial [Pirellulales bacterium]
FEAIYGEVGRGYIQVHHTMPLASRINPATTRLEDLILVCANCHAMIHVGRANRDPKELIRG